MITDAAGSALSDCDSDAVKAAPGPTSTKTRAPSDSANRSPSTKRTGSRTCSSQYAADPYPGPASSPVTLDTNSIRGSPTEMPSSTAAKSSIIGSISAEWNACETASRCTRRPCVARRSTTASTAPRSPETTTASGPLTAAMLTPSVSRDATSASAAATATIAPPAGSRAINRPRAATTHAASASDSTPATCAAASSPTEWPITTSGTTPQDRHSAANATSMANSAGCANSVLSNNSGSSPQTTCRSGNRRWPSNASAASSNARANSGKRPYSAAPMPNHCEPWPGNMKTVLPTDRALPTTAEAPGCPDASPASPSSRSARSPPTSTARCSKADRVVASDHPTSTTSAPGCAPTCAASRAA